MLVAKKTKDKTQNHKLRKEDIYKVKPLINFDIEMLKVNSLLCLQ